MGLVGPGSSRKPVAYRRLCSLRQVLLDRHDIRIGSAVRQGAGGWPCGAITTYGWLCSETKLGARGWGCPASPPSGRVVGFAV